MNEDAADIGNLIEPSPVGFTFDAPGWYAVGILLVLIVAGLMIWTWIIHIRNRYRREALRYVMTLESEITDKSLLVYEVNMLLKRIALRFMPRENVAPLRDEQWVDFL